MASKVGESENWIDEGDLVRLPPVGPRAFPLAQYVAGQGLLGRAADERPPPEIDDPLRPLFVALVMLEAQGEALLVQGQNAACKDT